MTQIGTNLFTHFASPERESDDIIKNQADALRGNPMLAWFDAMPMAMMVLNRHRQIIHSNQAFNAIAQKQGEEILGKRPGEAVDCVNAWKEKAGCGCSEFCDVCGAARAIVRSLGGDSDCQECRMLRMLHSSEVPMDLQIFTHPVKFKDMDLVLVFAMDISHELRLRYLNRTFYHGLINGVGGIKALAELIDLEDDESPLMPILLDSSRRTLRDVLYHYDIDAAENGRLEPHMETIELVPYLQKLVSEECAMRNTQDSCALIEGEAGEVKTDKRLLGHIVSNMLANALEAREENPGDISIKCEPLDDGRIAIIMRNPGVIPEDIQKQMFKRYVSTKSRDRGLGTYVIKLFAERYLGGEVSFFSDWDNTQFTVILPANK